MGSVRQYSCSIYCHTLVSQYPAIFREEGYSKLDTSCTACPKPLKGGTPYEPKVTAEIKQCKKGTRCVSDHSRAVHHMINRSEQKKRHARKGQGLSLTSQGWYDINHRVTPKRKSNTKSYKICFWSLKGGRVYTIRCQAQEKDSLVEC